MAERAAPAIDAIHNDLASAYRAAATTTERGEAIDFAGPHRAERRLEMIMTSQRSGTPTAVE